MKSVRAQTANQRVLASGAGITREALYKSLSASGDPRLTTLLGVTKALGIKISMDMGKPAAAKSAPSKRRPKRARVA